MNESTSHKSTPPQRKVRSTWPEDAVAAARVAELQAENGRVYHPELADWNLAVAVGGDRFSIHERTADGGTRAVLTVQIDPAIGTARDRAQIADFLALAPAIWRALRDELPFAEEDPERVGDVARATELLWRAAGRRPYEIRRVPDDDDALVARLMRAAGSVVVAAGSQM